MTLEDIQEYVKDKNVILVGNSENVKHYDKSKLIDDHDVVVRMNHAIPGGNLGDKTDIWLCSYNKKSDQTLKFSIFNADVNIRLNDDDNLHESLIDKFYIWPDAERDKIRKIIKSKYPSTGVMAIYFFTEYCQSKSLTIVYMDGFITKTFYNKYAIAEKYHNVMSEREYINNMVEGNKVKIC